MNDTIKPHVHITANYLLQPPNPVTVNLIGVGGTGSQVLSALARISHALVELGHPGLFVRAFDGDNVTPSNLGRQLFASAEIGMNKAVALINRVNRFFGTNWKAMQCRFEKSIHFNKGGLQSANLFISCVDEVQPRFDIADILLEMATGNDKRRDMPYYWMDYGNSQYTGQVILSTVGEIKQPDSKKFTTVGNLPFVTSEFKTLLLASEKTDDTPSCSLAEALTRQDLFINTALAGQGASLLWSLFREGMLRHRGFFMNLKDFRSQPIPVANTSHPPGTSQSPTLAA